MGFFMLLLFIKAVFLVPITLLPIINPLACAPIVANLLHGTTEKIERRVARQVAINCWVLLLGAILIGSHVLSFFGISLPMVRIAGGLVVAIGAWKMLNNDVVDSFRAQASNPETFQEELKIRAFYPISFPLTIGPGTIASSIAIGASLPTRPMAWMISVGSAVIGALITSILIYLCYRYARQLVNKLGPFGTIVALRLSAFILLCIGIEIFWLGLSGALVDLGLISK